MNKNLLIIDDLHPVFAQKAEKMGYAVSVQPHISRHELLEILPQYQGLAVRTRIAIDAEIIAAGTSLRFIARAGAGLDNIDEQAARAAGITLLSAGEGNCHAVAEHATGMLLSLLNNLRRADDEVRHGLWRREENRGEELNGKTVGIIGFGLMGQTFARLMHAFGCRVLVYDKYKTGFSTTYAQEASMEEIVKHTHVLSLHIPLTAETRQLVNEEYLFHFKKPIWFINTSRGPIVNTMHLLSALNSGKVLGAALDVLETEKPQQQATTPWYQPLINNQNVLLSPHIAGWSVQSYYKISLVLAQKLQQLQHS